MKNAMMEQFIRLANFAGGRFDLVQAGGGNVSWKCTPDEILIKKSGISMSEMLTLEQCARLNLPAVASILQDVILQRETEKKVREERARVLLEKSNMTPAVRPSIEAFLHALLYTFTLHTHPVAVNNLVIRKDAKKMIATLFPDSIFVDYATPGIELAIALKEAVLQFELIKHQQPHLIFLKNHGLIVSADDPSTVQALTESVVIKIEQTLGVDYARYRIGTNIAALFQQLTGAYEVAYLSEDQQILQILQHAPHLLQVLPTSPDAFVFNGVTPCELATLSTEPLQQYVAQYGIYPKVIIYQQQLFFIHQSIRKAKEMEEVFKFHLLALYNAQGEVESLPYDEFLYLMHWEAEKFRQKQ